MKRDSVKARLLQPFAGRLLPFLLLVLAGLAPALAPSAAETDGRSGRLEAPRAGQTAVLEQAALYGIRPSHSAEREGQGGPEGDAPHPGSDAAPRALPWASFPVLLPAGAASLPPAHVRPQSPRAPPFLV